MANIERLANDRLASGDQVAAIQATLHEHRTGCRLGKGASPDGEETSRLFAAWPDLALRATRNMHVGVCACMRVNLCNVHHM